MVANGSGHSIRACKLQQSQRQIEDLPSTYCHSTEINWVRPKYAPIIFVFIFSEPPLVRRTCIQVLRKVLGLMV